MHPDIVALVSLGKHPVSRKPRRADVDARALQLALGCGGAVTALHAGPAGSAPVLRDYAGMGAKSLVVLDTPPDSDPLPALEAYLRQRRPDLIVAGARAEAGEGSGMVPFWLAEKLDYALASSIVAVAPSGAGARLVQALPGGRRRELDAPFPLIITVDRTGPEPALAARARGLRALANLQPATAMALDPPTAWAARPSRPRPKRLLAPTAAGPAGGAEAAQRREMIAPDPEAAADAILDFLERHGLLAPPPCNP